MCQKMHHQKYYANTTFSPKHNVNNKQLSRTISRLLVNSLTFSLTAVKFPGISRFSRKVVNLQKVLQLAERERERESLFRHAYYKWHSIRTRAVERLIILIALIARFAR